MAMGLWIFLGQFVLVFALGQQSLHVNRGRYVAAAASSCVIGVCNLLVLKVVPSATVFEMLCYLSAGPLAIMSAIALHGRFFGPDYDEDGEADEIREAREAKALEEEAIAWVRAELAKPFVETSHVYNALVLQRQSPVEAYCKGVFGWTAEEVLELRMAGVKEFLPRIETRADYNGVIHTRNEGKINAVSDFDNAQTAKNNENSPLWPLDDVAKPHTHSPAYFEKQRNHPLEAPGSPPTASRAPASAISSNALAEEGAAAAPLINNSSSDPRAKATRAPLIKSSARAREGVAVVAGCAPAEEQLQFNNKKGSCQAGSPNERSEPNTSAHAKPNHSNSADAALKKGRAKGVSASPSKAAARELCCREGLCKGCRS